MFSVLLALGGTALAAPDLPLSVTAGTAYSGQGRLKDYTVQIGAGEDTAQIQWKWNRDDAGWHYSGWQLQSERYGVSTLLDGDPDDSLLIFAPVELGRALETGGEVVLDSQSGVGLNLLAPAGWSAEVVYLGPYTTAGVRGRFRALENLSESLRPVIQGGVAAGFSAGDVLSVRARAARAASLRDGVPAYTLACVQVVLGLGPLTGVYALDYDPGRLVDGGVMTNRVSAGVRF